MFIVYILSAIFLVLSIILLSGKGGFLIAGYNTASDEEKAKYDEKKLCRVMGIMMLLITVLTVLLAILNSEQYAKLYSICVVIIVVVTIIYVNLGCKKK